MLLTNKFSRLTAEKSSHTLIKITLRRINEKEKWEKNKWIVAVLITVAICWLIWYSAD